MNTKEEQLILPLSINDALQAFEDEYERDYCTTCGHFIFLCTCG